MVDDPASREMPSVARRRIRSGELERTSVNLELEYDVNGQTDNARFYSYRHRLDGMDVVEFSASVAAGAERETD